MPDYSGEKTIDPTPHRRQQARREGHVAKSHDLGSAAMLLAGLALLAVFGGGLMQFLADYCRTQLGGEPWLAVDAESLANHWSSTLGALSRRLLPILGLLCLAGVAVNVLQIGFLFLPQRAAFDFSRLDPLQGMHRIFSSANTVRLGFSLLKLGAALGVAGTVLYGERNAILGLTALSPAGIVAEATRLGFWIVLKIGAALLILALLDYTYQWWRHEQDLKMTPQELQEELRNLEGNPQVIARRKQARQEQASSRRREDANPGVRPISHVPPS